MSITFSEIVGAESLQETRVQYNKFLAALNEPGQPPVRIFEPLGKLALEQLELVREVSRYLQKKKEEEINSAEAKRVEEAKAAAAAAAAEGAPKQ